MKNILLYLSILIAFTTCQEVVEVDLETSQERLVIEAIIKWENDFSGNHQVIKLSKTASFYNNQFVPAIGASVKITNTNSLAVFTFTDSNNGIYQTNNFVPVVNDIYKLEINFNGETYTSSEKLLPAPVVIDVTQTVEGGFNVEEPEVNIFFQDILNQEDYYRIIFNQYRPSITELIETDTFAYDARFEADNIISDWYESDDIQVGDEFKIQVTKISKQFFTFWQVLEEQANAGVGPFASPPVNVRGNCINATNEDKYPYGYFMLNEYNTAMYTFQ